ncbi:transcriptional regulator [Neptuniibacter pectenicola]|jgi:Pyruvate/2-oxoacid:ferredoxin oxidoreductase delta subunit|uniref:Transcriptional regulator n=1 Tax=Neptuniibacter pectenicola TaxID=1806669 RepID=A0ABU9TMY0_9GAMM|nr:transcriptional regulator [Neptuniibacter pectenicola]KXJ51917.1 MAG: transcriptional regulator [Neptuniibacter sp. Phe_28]|tara:strand:+ start:124 stop:324 length:201 start_codon:yes stop_codon:yes gene_type:complete
MAEPKCPECSISGVEHIISKDSEERGRDKHPWFQVAYCDGCGHIYGVFAKHTITASTKGPQLVLNR